MADIKLLLVEDDKNLAFMVTVSANRYHCSA